MGLWLKHWVGQTQVFIPSFLLAHNRQIVSSVPHLQNRVNGSDLLYKVLWDLLMKKIKWETLLTLNKRSYLWELLRRASSLYNKGLLWFKYVPLETDSVKSLQLLWYRQDQRKSLKQSVQGKGNVFVGQAMQSKILWSKRFSHNQFSLAFTSSCFNFGSHYTNECNGKQDPTFLPEVQPHVILCCNINCTHKFQYIVQPWRTIKKN